MFHVKHTLEVLLLRLILRYTNRENLRESKEVK